MWNGGRELGYRAGGRVITQGRVGAQHRGHTKYSKRKAGTARIPQELRVRRTSWDADNTSAELLAHIAKTGVEPVFTLIC